MTQQAAKGLTSGQCREWIAENVFRLREADYAKKYPIWPGMVGLEVEMIPTIGHDALPRLLPLQGSGGLWDILRSMAQRYAWTGNEDQAGHLLSVSLDQKDQFTFEPGGQLEYSSKPYPCLSDALVRVEKIQALLDRTFAAHQIHSFQLGMNPWHGVEEIGLQMDKPRYKAMDQWFHRISEYGQRMMRQTCTIQVNLDFGVSGEGMARRYLAGNLLAPVATAVFANSPVTAGRLNGYRSFRSRIWQGLDKGRTGFPDLRPIADRADQQTCVDVYFDYVADAGVIFIADGDDVRLMDGSLTFRQWLEDGHNGRFPTQQDFETHLSLHFPEVRPKGFLELRSVDSQARIWQSVPAAFYTALLYDDKNLDACLDLLMPWLEELPTWLEKSSHGYQDPDLARMAGRIMGLVREGFSRLPPCFQGEGTHKALEAFCDHFVFRNRCPADDMLDRLQTLGKSSPEPDMIRSLEHSWQELL